MLFDANVAEPEPDVDEPESSFDALDVPVLAEAGSGLDTVDFPLDVLVLPSSPSDAVLSEALSSAAFAAPVPVDVVAVASSVESGVRRLRRIRGVRFRRGGLLARGRRVGRRCCLRRARLRGLRFGFGRGAAAGNRGGGGRRRGVVAVKRAGPMPIDL